MPNIKSVVHFLLVGGGYIVTSCCDGRKTKSTPSPTDLDWTVRLDWSLTKKSFWAKIGEELSIRAKN